MTQANTQGARQGPRHRLAGVRPDYWLLGAAVTLLSLGLVMVASASLPMAEERLHQPFYYVIRQALFIGLGLVVGFLAWRMPLRLWERFGSGLFLIGLLLLAAVLVPGVGREVNGSSRWLPLGAFNVQVSEFVKVFAVIYIAGYLVRRAQEVCIGWWGFFKPMVLLVVACGLLLVEPDFGAASVLWATVLGMMFIGGARLSQFIALLALAAGMAALLVVSAPYRMERILAFLDPWADPYNSGFQLTQALIAFGRGEWLGVGLGASIQKLFYLPEAHTDFLFAVIAEELGLVGAIGVILLFTMLIWRALSLGHWAARLGQPFAGYLAWGLGLLLGLQAFINLGVNMGLLPTKGLTLPLMSYGGSSMLAACLAVGLLLRIHEELQRVAPYEILERDRWVHV